MNLPFSLSLALRYLVPHRNFLSIITVISILGVVFACVALVVVIPVMTGFENSIKERLLGSQPHALFKIAASPGEAGYPVPNWRDQVEVVSGFDEVEMAFPVVEGAVFMEVGNRRSPQPMFAIDPADPFLVTELEEQLALADHPQSRTDLGSLPADDSLDGVCLVNSLTATNQNLRVGSVVTLYSPSTVEKLIDRVEELEREPLAERAGDELLTLRDRLVESFAPAAPDPDAPTVPANLPLRQAEAISVPIALVNETLEILTSLSDSQRPIDLTEEEFVERNRAYEEEQLGEAIAALQPDRAAWVDRDRELVIFPATEVASPLADVRDLLEDLGTPLTDQERDNSFKQLRQVILPKSLEVIGVYRGIGTSASVIVPLHIGQELYSLGEGVHGIGVRVAEPYEFATPQLREQLIDEARRRLGPGWTVESWYDRYGTLFGQIAVERKIMYIILFIIMVVAAFCICSNLVTTTVLKRREMGLLKAFGATAGQISAIFVLQGFVVGLIGTLSGLGLGLLLLEQRNRLIDWVRDTTGFDLFPPDVYGLDGGLPAEITPEHLAIVCLGAFLFSTLAALPPAVILSRLQPAPALRAQGA